MSSLSVSEYKNNCILLLHNTVDYSTYVLYNLLS